MSFIDYDGRLSYEDECDEPRMLTGPLNLSELSAPRAFDTQDGSEPVVFTPENGFTVRDVILGGKRIGRVAQQPDDEAAYGFGRFEYLAIRGISFGAESDSGTAFRDLESAVRFVEQPYRTEVQRRP